MCKGDHDDLRRFALFQQSGTGVGCSPCGEDVIYQQDRCLDQARICLKLECLFDIQEPLFLIQLRLGPGWLLADQQMGPAGQVQLPCQRQAEDLRLIKGSLP